MRKPIGMITLYFQARSSKKTTSFIFYTYSFHIYVNKFRIVNVYINVKDYHLSTDRSENFSKDDSKAVWYA
jgi:hypothetical protein